MLGNVIIYSYVWLYIFEHTIETAKRKYIYTLILKYAGHKSTYNKHGTGALPGAAARLHIVHREARVDVPQARPAAARVQGGRPAPQTRPRHL